MSRIFDKVYIQRSWRSSYKFAQLSEESSTCGGFQNGSGSHVVHDDLIGLGGLDGHDGHDGHDGDDGHVGHDGHDVHDGHDGHVGHDGHDGHAGHDGHDGHSQHLPTGENVHCGSRPRPAATRC